MRLWLLALLLCIQNVFAGTIIVYDETVSRFVDRDLSYLTSKGRISSTYHSNREWSNSELTLVRQQRTTNLPKKYDNVIRVTEDRTGLYFFEKYSIGTLVGFFDKISYSVPYILIVEDSNHSLDIIPLIKSYAATHGITVESATLHTKYELETTLKQANLQQRGLILNFALTLVEGETGAVLTYNEISQIVASRNSRHLVVGLNRKNAVCLCETKRSMAHVTEGGNIEFGVTLNATRLEAAGQRAVLLDGMVYAEEVIFE